MLKDYSRNRRGRKEEEFKWNVWLSKSKDFVLRVQKNFFEVIKEKLMLYFKCKENDCKLQESPSVWEDDGP